MDRNRNNGSLSGSTACDAARLAERHTGLDHLKASVHPSSGRNRLHLIELDGEATILLKQFFDRTGFDTEMEAAELSAVMGLNAPYRFVDDATSTIAFAYLEDHQTLAELGRDDAMGCIEQWVRLGEKIASWHGLRGFETTTASPWQIAFPALDPVEAQAWLRSSLGAREVMQNLLESDGLPSTYERTRRGLGPHGFIHGDLRADNVLINDERLAVIDWELSGHGPLAVDLASSIGSIVEVWLRGLDLDPEAEVSDWVSRGSVPYEAVGFGAVRLMTRYLSTLPEELTPPSRTELANHISSYLVARSWNEAGLRDRANGLDRLRLLVASNVDKSPEALFGGFDW